MAILALLWCLTLFVGLVFGLGLPLVCGLALRAEDKLYTAAAPSVVVLYLWGLMRYWLDFPMAASTVLPTTARGCSSNTGRPLLLALLASLFALAVLRLIREHAATCSTQS
jgi:hypothetical protein